MRSRRGCRAGRSRVRLRVREVRCVPRTRGVWRTARGSRSPFTSSATGAAALFTLSLSHHLQAVLILRRVRAQRRWSHAQSGLHRVLVARRRAQGRPLPRRRHLAQPDHPRHHLEPGRAAQHGASAGLPIALTTLAAFPSQRNADSASPGRVAQVFPTYRPGFDGLKPLSSTRGGTSAPIPLLVQTELSGLLNLCRLEVRPFARSLPAGRDG